MSTTELSYSLRSRMLLRTGTLMIVTLLLLSVGVWQYAKQAADISFDRLLNSASLSIMERIRVNNNQITLDIPYAALSMMELSKDDKVFYQVKDHNGILLTGYADLPEPKKYKPSDIPQFYNAEYKGETLRLVTQSKRLSDSAISGWVQVTLAQTRGARDDLTYDIFYNALFTLVCIVLLALMTVWIGINRALNPLSVLSHTLQTRTANDPTPLPATPMQEVSPLVNAINNYQQKLQHNLDTMKVFIADSTHQIRTALSATQAQLDISLQENDAQQLANRLQKIRQEHLRLTRLTNQLLAHALVVHRGDTQTAEVIDLDALLKQVLTDCVRDYAHTNIEFEYTAPKSAITYAGDSVSLKEAIKNLLDNAVRYGPENNVIHLTLCATDQAVEVIVDDKGPGIPPHLRRQAVQRFSRLVTSKQGSGLGLAIVEAVAHAHKGSLQLETSPDNGLRVRLLLPKEHL